MWINITTLIIMLDGKACIFCRYGTDDYYGNTFIEIPNSQKKIYHAHPFCILKTAKRKNQYDDATTLIERGLYEMTYTKVDDIEL
jgi:hypothetical protein